MSQNMQDYIMDICVAYEEGYTIGEQNLSSSLNKYREQTERYYAWHYGHNSALTNQLLHEGSMDIVFNQEN